MITKENLNRIAEKIGYDSSTGLDFNPLYNDSHLLSLIKVLLMRYDCEILTDENEYFIYIYDIDSDIGKNLLSHNENFEKAVIEAFIEIL